jgi:hypothetical protein
LDIALLTPVLFCSGGMHGRSGKSASRDYAEAVLGYLGFHKD